MSETVKWNGPKIYQRTVNALIRKMERLGGQMERDIKASMKPGTGREYPSRTGKGMHKASKPYYPPAPDTGDLKKSISHSVWYEPGAVHLRVGTDIPYAKWLEIGTRKMLPRPFLRPCLERFRPKIAAIIGRDGSIRVFPIRSESSSVFGEGSLTS